MNEQNRALEALGTVAGAGKAPDSVVELEELSSLLRIPAALLATQPEHVRRQWKARALAKNPGLLRFARENALNQSVAVENAQAAYDVARSFEDLAKSGGQAPRPEERPYEGPESEIGGDSGLGQELLRQMPRFLELEGLAGEEREEGESGEQRPEDLDKAWESLAAGQGTGLEGPEEGEPDQWLDGSFLTDLEETEKRGESGLEREEGESDQEGLEDPQGEGPADLEDFDLYAALKGEGLDDLAEGGDEPGLRGIDGKDGPEDLGEPGPQGGESGREEMGEGESAGPEGINGKERKEGGEGGAVDYLLDPFRNFANGFLDLARGVLGAGKSLGDLGMGPDSALSRWFDEWLAALDKAEFQTSKADSFGGRLARDVVRSTPQLLSQLALWLTTGPAAASSFIFSQVYGGDYLKHQGKGISPGNAAMAGLLDGALQTAMERVGLHAILRAPGLAEFGKSLGTLGLGEMARNAGRAGLVEGATEAAQHMPEYLTDWWAQSSINNSSQADRLAWTWRQALDARNLLEGTKEALYEGLVGGILGAGASGGLSAWSRRRLDPELTELLARERERASAVMRRLALEKAFAQAGKALEGVRDAEAARRVARASLPENVSTALLSAEDLASLLARGPSRAQQLLEATGSTVEAVNAALERGTDLEVDLASAICARTEEGRLLRESLRLEADGPTLGEASAWDPDTRFKEVMRVLNQEDELEGFSEDERTQFQAEEAGRLTRMSARVDRQIRRLEGELRDLGLSALEAESNAALLRAHALSWWKRYGMDGAALLEGVHVERGEGVSGGRARLLGGPELEPEENVPEVPEWMSGEKGPKPRRTVLRGQIALKKAGAIIRLFKDRDVSTFGHEASHLFLQDLMGLVNGGQGRVLERLQDELAEQTGEDVDFAGELAQDLLASREEFADQGEALRDWAGKLMRRYRGQKEQAEELDKRRAAGELEPGAELDANIMYTGARATALRNMVRAARQAARHAQACEEARQDLDLFADHAGLGQEQLEAALRAAGDLSLGEGPELAAFTRIQEATAQSFISWLAGGKAPSPRLAPVLARFKQWLGNLWARYKNVRAEKLSPELAAAFDRLLSHEGERRLQEGVDALARHEYGFIDQHFKGEENRKLRALLGRARAYALSRGERQIRRREEREYARRAARLYKEMATDPFWLVAEKGRFASEDVERLLGVRRTAALREVWPRIFGKKAVNVDEAASEAGFESAEAMFESLYIRLVEKGQSRRGEAERLAGEELARAREERGDQAFPLNGDLGGYLRMAEEAVSRMAARLRLASEAEVERWVNQSRVPQNMIDALAGSRVATTPVRELTPRNLERQLNRCLAKRDRLLAGERPENMMEALNQANEARVIYAMMEAANKAHKKLGELRKLGRKIAEARAGTYASAQTEALRLVLDAYGLGRMRVPVDYAYVRALPDLLREIMEQEGSGDGMAVFPDWLLERRHPLGSDRARDTVIQPQYLSPSQVDDLYNLLSFLEHSGKMERKGDVENDKEWVKAAAATCAESMESLPDRRVLPEGPRDFVRRLGDKAFAAVDILLWQARKGDGMRGIMGKGDKGGLERIWEAITAGEERVRAWHDRVQRALAPHLEQLDKARRRLEREYGKNMRLYDGEGKPILPPAKWRKAYHSESWTPEMLFALACHMGNRSNITRLLSGYAGEDGLDARSLGALLGERVAQWALEGKSWLPRGERPEARGLLTAADWQAIQGIWDALALLWPDTQMTHKKLYGFAPDSVGSAAFYVSGDDGQPLALKGGYFPVRYDGRIEERVGAWSEEEDLLARNEAMYSVPSAKKGFTKTRTEQAPGLPVLLNLSPIASHITDAARFIELAEPVRRFDRVTRDARFAEVYKRKFGQEDYNAIRPNLRGLLRTEKLPDFIAWLEQRVRKYVVPWGLSLNVNVALMQSTAIFPAMADLGPREIMGSIRELLLRPSLRRDIWKASPYMLSRMNNLDQDLVRQIRQIGAKKPASIRFRGKDWTYDDVVDLGMKMITVVDAASTCVVWYAAYRAKLKELRAKAVSLDSDKAIGQAEGAGGKIQFPLPSSVVTDVSGSLLPPASLQAASQNSSRQETLEDASGGSGGSRAAGSIDGSGVPAQARASQGGEDGGPAASGAVNLRLGETAGEALTNTSREAAGDISSDSSSMPAGDSAGGPESMRESSSDPLNKDADGTAGGTGESSSKALRKLGELGARAGREVRELFGGNASVDFEDAFHDEAARFADLMVKQSNPDFDASSRSSFLRSRGMMRLFNQFSSAVTLFASRNHYMFKAMSGERISKGRYARHLAGDFLFPAIFLYLLFGCARDFWDKEDKPLTNFTGLLLDQVSMSVPIFGGIASDWTQNLLGMGSGNYRRGDLRVSMDAPVELGGRASQAVNTLVKGTNRKEERRAAIYALLDVISFLARIPVSKVARKGERGYEQYKRGEGTPVSIILPKGGK